MTETGLELDVRTIYMMNAVVYLMLHGIIWVSLARYQSRLVSMWSASGIVSALGVLLLGSQGLIAEWVVAVIGQLLMALGNYGRQYALRCIDQPPTARWVWGQGLFNLLYLGVNGTLFFSGASHAQMMVVFFGFYAINCFDYHLAGREIARRRDSAGARSVQWAGLVFTASLATKGLSVWAGWGASGLYDPGWDQMVLFVGQFLALSLLNFGFMQILVDQFQQDRARAEHDLLEQRDRTVRAEQHSLDLTHLLREREEIIRQLTLSNKNAGMGALVSGIAHEINQPLASMVLKSELIESYLDQPDGNAEVRQLCARIRNDAMRSGTMIRTLRSMFDIGRGGFQRIDFAALLRDVTGMVASHAQGQGIALDIDVPDHLWLSGDATQLQQVVLNLLNNAVQAVKAAAAPRVLVQCRVQDGAAMLRVQDNGCGIALPLQADVFALFKSPQARDMGVGLWLSQAVVESHGGKLAFQSTPGQGTVFWFSLSLQDNVLVF